MPWVVGFEEAGYGPLVQTAVAVWLPAADPAGWDNLRWAVRRCHEKRDARLRIDDSKKVSAGGTGSPLVRAVGLRAVAERLAGDVRLDGAEVISPPASVA